MEDELELEDDGYPCLFNDGCQCKERDCGHCGWNPVVAKARLERILKKM